MKKILFMMNDLHGGGQEKAIVSLLSELANYKEYEITLLLMKKQGVFLDCVPTTVKVKVVPVQDEIIDENTLSSKERLKNAITRKNLIACVRVLYHYIHHRNKDISEIMKESWERYDKTIDTYPEEYDYAIDYQGQGTFPTYYVAKKINAKKKYSWVHNDFSIVAEDMSWIGECYKFYDKILSVSVKAQNAFISRFPEFRDKAAVCYNVMNQDEIIELSKKQDILPDKGVNIVTVGRLSYEKGYDIALKALKLLKDSNTEFTYWIIGNGEDEEILKSLVMQLDLSNEVKFVGFKKNPYPYIRMADIYLQPSRYEGFCLTLGEAKVLNKVIITTDFAGASEQITNGVNGSIVACEPDAIFNMLKNIIDNHNVIDMYLLKGKKKDKNLGLDQFLSLM